MSSANPTNIQCVTRLMILYDYLDETTIALLKMVCKDFYDTIMYITDEYQIKSTNIKLFRLYSGTVELAKFAMSMSTMSQECIFLKIVEYGSLDTIKYFIENKLIKNILTDKCCQHAASNSLDVLQYFHINGYHWDASTCANAACCGNLDCLKYAYENGCKWNELATQSAVMCKKMDCVQYLCENKCPKSEKTTKMLLEILSNGMIDLIAQEFHVKLH